MRIWDDKWLPENPGYKVLSGPKGLDKDAKVELIDHNLCRWNMILVNLYFTPEEAKQVCNIPLSIMRPRDNLIWHFEKDKSCVVCVRSWVSSTEYFGLSEMVGVGLDLAEPFSVQLVCTTLWSIWNVRNQRVFKNYLSDPEVIAGKVVEQVVENNRVNSCLKFRKKLVSTADTTWCNIGFYSIQLDADSFPYGVMAMGCTIRNHDRNVVLAVCKRLVSSANVSMVEAFAIK
ncbi:hypothetical protein KIW84_066123 [Lathyrus oleraceus]|uniref:Uncharacterized protein n=1 Tax=Pisum sativum TaxID=3888 RepID=A0A9D5A894_PEA|nr:hypothetical protein KIW84_066123 [Pisum sativum]